MREQAKQMKKKKKTRKIKVMRRQNMAMPHTITVCVEEKTGEKHGR
jgi:ribosomal protein S19